MSPPSSRFASRLRDSRKGGVLILAAVALPPLLGAAALATEAGTIYLVHQRAQNAADSAAMGAATAFVRGNHADALLEARSTASNYGFIHTGSETKITVNTPPRTGRFTTAGDAVEVIVEQKQDRTFSRIWAGNRPIDVGARAVAVGSLGACVLALNPTAQSAISMGGSSELTLRNCSAFANSNRSNAIDIGGSADLTAHSVGTVGGVDGVSKITTVAPIRTGAAAIADPYASRVLPPFSGCNYTAPSVSGPVTLNPGVICGGLTANSDADITLNPGIYYLDRGLAKINGGAKIRGAGVTIVFTSSTGSNFATMDLNGGAIINLSPPATGPTAGIVFFGDRNMPQGTFYKINGGATQTLKGAIYFPRGRISYSGNAGVGAGCIQLIGDTLTFSGNSDIEIVCPGVGTAMIGGGAGKLVE